MKKQANSPTPDRLIDKYFKQYTDIYQTQNKRVILMISGFMLMFGLLGLLWAVPFPHLNWLGSYNGYINWASFFIAIAGYYYYRLSPVIGYLVILLMLLLTYLVTLLQGWEHVTGLSLKLISSLLIMTSILMWVLINKRLWDKQTVVMALTNFIIGPLWGLHLLFKKAGVRY